jgi:integrase
MTGPRPRSPRPKQLDAEILQAEISSFALRLAADGKAAKTIRTYSEAVRWFAAACLPGRAGWEQVDRQDILKWMVWLLDRYSSAYASNQYRALQHFFKWLAAEDELPDPMTGLQPPRVTDKLVPVFTGDELARLEQACAGRTFAQRRDAAIIAVFRATGIRLAELADILYHASEPRRSDVDLWQQLAASPTKDPGQHPGRQLRTHPVAVPGRGQPRQSRGIDTEHRVHAGVGSCKDRSCRRCSYPEPFGHLEVGGTPADAGRPAQALTAAAVIASVRSAR